MAEPSSASQNATCDSKVDPADHLPLTLLRSEIIPPAPNRSGSSIDWLPDFADYSWVAYGSSSLLVISHFPSPLSSDQTLMGPIFRQVFELSSSASLPVTAVSWSPVMPSSGELAAASDNCIFLYSHDSATLNSKGSFCWSQNAVLLQCSKVEAVEWTASGDGIIAGGFEVVLWKRKSKLWEIAWKFKADQPQNLVSASWSIEGPSAAASYSKGLQSEGGGGGVNEPSKSVLVFYSDGSSGYTKAVLGHPQPVSMIQWRPSAGKELLCTKHSRRHILLTCCLDGTVRLWSEIDNGRVKKAGKDGSNDHKTTRRSFFVSAVVEIDCSLRGSLGVDIYLTWATEFGGIVKTSEETNQYFSTEGYKLEAGRCEWLIGFGPGKLVSFWAVHCLDDMSPMRFPRVTLWKRQELEGLEFEHLHRNELSTLKELLLLKKVVIMRNSLSGPPTVCSMIHSFSCKSLAWSMLYTKMSKGTEDASPSESRTEDLLSCSVGGFLDMDGHSSKILQVAIHPYVCEVELAVSLDSNGLVLFWSLSTSSNCSLDLPTLIPAWKICGKHVTRDKCSKYTSLSWAPLILAEDQVLLMGHVGGIDCFAVKIFHGAEDDVVCHYICTIPFTGDNAYDDGPTNLYSVPLSLSCNKTSICDGFLLLGIWKESWALSWEIKMHAYDLTGSYSGCNFDDNSIAECSSKKFENTISGTSYCLHVLPSSAHLPEIHLHDQVTSFAVISPGGLTLVRQKLAFDNDPYSIKNPAYVMATGCSDGSLKLWRYNPYEPSISKTPWELVGMLTAHQGPVRAICLTNCGRRIATIGSDSQSNVLCNLRIWESVHLADSGTFMLEDSLSLEEGVVALNWLALGNGQLLLAVCMHNELRLYAQKRCAGHSLLNCKKSKGMQIWFCIGINRTFSAIRDFLWGPRTTGVVVHASYLTLLSPWLFLIDKNHQTEFYLNCISESLLDSEIGTDEGTLSEIFSKHNVFSDKETLIENGNVGCKSDLSKKMNAKNSHLSGAFSVGRAQLKSRSKILLGYWSMLDIVERLAGVLPIYHPEALFANIYSGNWKRAYISVRHLVEYLNSSYISEKRDHLPKISNIVPEMPLSDYIEGTLSKSSTENVFQWSENASLMTSSSQFQSGLMQFAYNLAPDASSNMFNLSSKYGLRDFLEPINKLYELAAITATEKLQTLAIIDLLNELHGISNPQSASVYGNLDEPGRRFWVSLRFQQLFFSQKFGRAASLEELVVDSELIVWAFHSDCQETLFGSVLPNEPSWQEMRTLGVGFWFTNAMQLRTRMEKLARMQYLKKKDPKDCTLLYVALNRLQVLAGLFKISKDEKDKPLVGFLSRNFQEEKNKAAALKNAYVLLGKHQLELAIAFFLLGGDTSSAVTICAKNLGDEQLALVICRLVEGRGGPLECHLITKLILPSAIERSDYWLASLLEWELGNHSQSFLTMLGLQVGSAIDSSTLSSCHVAFMDPSIGLYCLILSSKNSMRNAVGDQNAGVLARWASLMTATSLKRCGLPLEALECLSSSPSILGVTDQENVSDFACSETSLRILKPFISDSSPWLLGDVALHVESYAKLDLALQYISKLIREHPSWPRTSIGSVGGNTCSEDYENQYDKQLESFQHKLRTGLAQFEQKFLLISSCLINMIFVSLCNNGFWFLGYDILHGWYTHEHSQYENHIIDDDSLWYPLLQKPVLKLTEDITFLFLHFISACSITCSPSNSCCMEKGVSHEIRSNLLDAWGCHFQGVKLSFWSLRAVMRIFSGIFKEVGTQEALTLLDLYEYYAHFASAWLQKNSEGLFLMMQPLLITYTNGHTPYEVDMSALKKMAHQVLDTATYKTLTDNLMGGLKFDRCAEDKQVEELLHSISEDERWHIIGAFLWQHMSRFMEHKLNSLAISDDDNPSCFSHGKLSSCASGSFDFESDSKSIREKIRSLSWILAKLLKIALEHISSYHVKQLGLFLQQKVDKGFHPSTLVWLEESRLSSKAPHQHLAQGKDIANSTNKLPAFDILWNVCADPMMISESFAQERINWKRYFHFKPSKGWVDVYKDITGEHDSDESHNCEGRISNSSSGGEAGSPTSSVFRNGHTLLSSRQKDKNMEKEVTPFQNPKEIYKRNGELLEALCVNSIDQRQAALASNRKGIIFFHWEDNLPHIDQSDYIWSGADWPHNGWAGCESTPVPTCVSPGVGLGSKKGAHLGLGGATIGVGSLARPGRDLTGGGAFGVPGYAGIGASGLGWEMQEEFEEFVDPPATVENISTRAFSSHPSRPFLLVGSINTHVYLWEYGKDKATATYGVLPAANVAPPYALASISALRFDHCGHRFATAALDGTVCTWQLEVGGRSNVCPTESSLCFNNHASDVTYVTSSGSVIAASGCSSNGVNVVIWDTLAPPATSRASIICHEGGARSIAVFDNDIGSGSVSPLIVTGGKNGDVGLHDFRYIATGRTKRHRHHDGVETSINTSSSADMRTGASNQLRDQKLDGMLWYIPKAHSGSITKISTIPNTSLFLTGSKDGDIKLWDAKATKLVYHWSKVHERHTFLQPSSRGFGGVVRAAVTDIQVVSHGFLSCGGDGSVKLVQLDDYLHV